MWIRDTKSKAHKSLLLPFRKPFSQLPALAFINRSKYPSLPQLEEPLRPAEQLAPSTGGEISHQHSPLSDGEEGRIAWAALQPLSLRSFLRLYSFLASKKAESSESPMTSTKDELVSGSGESGAEAEAGTSAPPALRGQRLRLPQAEDRPGAPFGSRHGSTRPRGPARGAPGRAPPPPGEPGPRRRASAAGSAPPSRPPPRARGPPPPFFHSRPPDPRAAAPRAAPSTCSSKRFTTACTHSTGLWAAMSPRPPDRGGGRIPAGGGGGGGGRAAERGALRVSLTLLDPQLPAAISAQGPPWHHTGSGSPGRPRPPERQRLGRRARGSAETRRRRAAPARPRNLRACAQSAPALCIGPAQSWGRGGGGRALSVGRTGCAARCFRSAVRCGLERVAGSVLKREERFFSESAGLGVTAPGTAPSRAAHAVIAHRSLPAVRRRHSVPVLAAQINARTGVGPPEWELKWANV